MTRFWAGVIFGGMWSMIVIGLIMLILSFIGCTEYPNGYGGGYCAGYRPYSAPYPVYVQQQYAPQFAPLPPVQPLVIPAPRFDSGTYIHANY